MLPNYNLEKGRYGDLYNQYYANKPYLQQTAQPVPKIVAPATPLKSITVPAAGSAPVAPFSPPFPDGGTAAQQAEWRAKYGQGSTTAPTNLTPGQQQNLQTKLAVANKTTPGVAAPGTPAAPKAGTSNFYTPELEGLKHSYLNKDWFSGSPYGDLFKQYMEKASTPVDVSKIGLTPEQMQGQLNMLKANMLGTTSALQGQTTNQMAASGFVPGESGKADTALGQIAREGQTNYANSATNLLLDEAKRREAIGLQAEDINTQRLLAGSKYADLLEGGAEKYAGMGLEAGAMGTGMEQFPKSLAEKYSELGLEQNKFGYQKEQDALNTYLNFLANQQGQQQQAWDPYWNSVLRYGQ